MGPVRMATPRWPHAGLSRKQLSVPSARRLRRASCFFLAAAGLSLGLAWSAGQVGSQLGLAFARKRSPEPAAPDVRQQVAVGGLSLLLVACFGVWWYRQYLKELRRLKRPYTVQDLDAPGAAPVQDAAEELAKAISWLQEQIVLPIDKRLPGRPFEYDIQYFPCMPTVLIIGNHSSGKSTFINRLMGDTVQETGVAPTDDGFTVLERSAAEEQFEDGPTLMSCSQNRSFRDLQRFGRAFSGHFRRKRVTLPENSEMPYGLQLVDTPGMIDLPGNNQSTNKARGYNFVDVVRWWAKRSDLILLLFDPDKPGTTGETLEVLTKSLSGLDHKFLVVMNKVDQLDNNVDFARAYGTLGWALSKVIPQKDIPAIWTMYNESCSGGGAGGGERPRHHELQLEAFVKNRREVVREVLRAKVRHYDNVVTSFEECLRQIDMVATVSAEVSRAIRLHQNLTWGGVGTVLAVPWLGALWLLGPAGLSWPGPMSALVAAAVAYGMVCTIACGLLQEYLRQFERLQVNSQGLDATFEKVYHFAFVHTDGEDLRTRWDTVKPRINSLVKSVPSAGMLPRIAPWEIARIEEVLDEDIWYFRQLAKMMRPPEPGLPGAGQAQSRSPTAARRPTSERTSWESGSQKVSSTEDSWKAETSVRRPKAAEVAEPKESSFSRKTSPGEAAAAADWSAAEDTARSQQRREARRALRQSLGD
eukprot:TRINITY_DN2526_c0_g1_i2.p1 TRINITY_DN2526_c0_g1~~TRINITY_DN2526_c0_g1_i2.p1  ORF type:complete len:708 (-),score=108.16 TRINITY_DN2526_c0_g1_i2:45-2144(-)